MALEKYTVFYNVQEGGQQPLANWKSKTVKTKAGEKTQGLINSDTEPSRTIEPTALITNNPQECRFVTIEAESRTEAAEAIRAVYGQSLVPNVCLSVLSSNLEEAKMQV